MLSPAGAMSESSKDYSIILLDLLFEDEGNLMILENSMSLSPMLFFICYKMSFFVRSSVAWNTMKVNNAFCKPTEGGFSRSIECRKGKTISSINVFSSEKKGLLLQRWKWSSVINLLPGGCWFPQGMVLFQGLSVDLDLCSWQVGYWAMALAKLALISGNPGCWSHK